MGKLQLYGVFHANLDFSYVPRDVFPRVLRQCYWPLLRTVEDEGIPLGLELSAHTLEVVSQIDPAFVARLRTLWEDGACEVMGSGYVQAIMPLIPARVNRENLRWGNKVYEEILGRRPRLAYVNEQVYSAGLPRLYKEAGYEAILVNWDSTPMASETPELLYRPCVVPAGDSTMPILWHATAAYRRFQQYADGSLTIDAFLEGLLAHLPDDGERAFPLYSSDWEAFDFKPWRSQPEGFPQVDLGEMDRIRELLCLLKRRQDMEFMLPSAVISHFPDPPVVHPESSGYPLPYKKQGLHGVARWAVGGRDAVRLNTQCHQLYQLMERVDRHVGDRGPVGLHDERGALWKELCFLWNSDFRTFTTEEKDLEFRNRMGAARYRAERLLDTSRMRSESPVSASLSSPQRVPHRAPSVPRESETIETPSVRLRLDPQRGGTIASLTFPGIAAQPLIQSRRGHAPSLLQLDGVASPGGLALEDQQGRKLTDAHATDLLFAEAEQEHELFIPVRCWIETDLGTIWKTYHVYRDQPRVDLIVRFQWKSVVPRFFRMGWIPLNPSAFDRETVYYATVNGGDEIERFPLRGENVRQGEPIDALVSSRGGVGASEGWVVLGDAHKGVGFVTRPAQLYSMPLVHYEEQGPGEHEFSLTLTHSLGESDDTSHTLWRGHSTWSITLVGGAEDIVASTRAATQRAHSAEQADEERD